MFVGKLFPVSQVRNLACQSGLVLFSVQVLSGASHEIYHSVAEWGADLKGCLNIERATMETSR